MEFTSFENFYALLWSGAINDTRLMLLTERETIGGSIPPVTLHSAITMKKARGTMYSCAQEGLFQVLNLD